MSSLGLEVERKSGEHDGIEWGEQEETDMTEPDGIEEPSLEDELAYEHRPKESTPTRKSLSQAARELATEVGRHVRRGRDGRMCVGGTKSG